MGELFEKQGDSLIQIPNPDKGTIIEFRESGEYEILDTISKDYLRASWKVYEDVSRIEISYLVGLGDTIFRNYQIQNWTASTMDLSRRDSREGEHVVRLMKR